MTMVPAENLSKQSRLPHGVGRDFYCCCGSNYTENFGLMSRVHGYDYHSEACLGSDVGANHMAEDESRTNSLTEARSSSKDNSQEQEDQEGWLQLCIGGQATRYHYNQHDQGYPTARRGGLTQLDLLPGGSSHQERPHMPEIPAPPHPPIMDDFGTSLLFQQRSSSTFPHGEISGPFRPIAQNIVATLSSSISSSLVPLGSYFGRPFQVQSGIDFAGPSSDVRIIDPPRRPHSGVWFMLQASQNQAKEPVLPQIPKCYLRIKDGKMTVRLVIKYLVNKLRLDSESEIEIRCKGQQLPPSLTLQHVRDQIWSSSDVVTLLPLTSTTPNHLMLLHYGRSA